MPLDTGESFEMLPFLWEELGHFRDSKGDSGSSWLLCSWLEATGPRPSRRWRQSKREWPQVTRRPVRLCRTSAVDGVLSCEPLLLGKCAFSCPGHAARSHGLGSAMSRGEDSITRPESRVHDPKAPRSRKATGDTTHPQAEPWCCRGPSGVQGRGS